MFNSMPPLVLTSGAMPLSRQATNSSIPTSRAPTVRGATRRVFRVLYSGSHSECEGASVFQDERQERPMSQRVTAVATARAIWRNRAAANLTRFDAGDHHVGVPGAAAGGATSQNQLANFVADASSEIGLLIATIWVRIVRQYRNATCLTLSVCCVDRSLCTFRGPLFFCSHAGSIDCFRFR